MKIAFFAEKCLPVHGNSLNERPVGGIETGLIRLAEALLKRGHDIRVFTSHTSPPSSEVPYFPYQEVVAHQPYDVFVAIKDWSSLFYAIKSDAKLFWTGDGFDQYINFGLGDKRVVSRVDRLLAVSSWHAETLCSWSGFPLSKARVIGNGVHLPYFEGKQNRDRFRLIYSSAPNRGLELALHLIPEIRKKVSEVTLHVFSGLSLYDTDRPYQGPEAAYFQRLAQKLAKVEGIILRGNLLQGELAKEFLKSSLLFYPNTMFETCCITALEAQAAGCPVVASANSALPETVGDAGVLINGEAGSPHYLTECVEATVELLKDKSYWKKLSDRGKERIISSYTWERVAERFEGALTS